MKACHLHDIDHKRKSARKCHSQHIPCLTKWVPEKRVEPSAGNKTNPTVGENGGGGETIPWGKKEELVCKRKRKGGRTHAETSITKGTGDEKERNNGGPVGMETKKVGQKRGEKEKRLTR